MFCFCFVQCFHVQPKEAVRGHKPSEAPAQNTRKDLSKSNESANDLIIRINPSNHQPFDYSWLMARGPESPGPKGAGGMAVGTPPLDTPELPPARK